MSTPTHPISFEYILGLTAFTSGTIDIVTYTQLGGVLASAMTGNLAFLGLYTASGEMFRAIGALIALLGYIAGTAFGQIIARGRLRSAALSRLLAAETFLLAVAVFVWFLAGHHAGSLAAGVIIVALALAMGTQSITGKQINLSNIPTVVFTSTLTNIVIGITENLARGRGFRLSADTRRQLASFFLYLFGAFCAGLLVYSASPLIIALPLATTAAALGAHWRAGAEAHWRAGAED